MYIVVVKRNEWHFSEVVAVIRYHITILRIHEHIIIGQQFQFITGSTPECLTLRICPVFVHRVIVTGRVINVRIHPHGSDQPAFKAPVKHWDNLLTRNNCPLKAVITLPVMHPADSGIGGIYTQLHAVLGVFIPQGFCDALIVCRTAYIEQRRRGKGIGGFLIHDQSVEVPGNPVVCVAQRIVGFFFFLVFRLISKQDVCLVTVIPICHRRPRHKCGMTRFIFFYQLSHCFNVHCYSPKIPRF